MKNKYLAKAGSTALATLIIATGIGVPAQAATTPSSNAINTYSRAAVAAAYANQWVPATTSPINWTGNAAGCQAGTESADSLAKGAQAVNFYRGLAGLDSISLTASQNTLAQQTALLMEANGQISHTPSSSWLCYTDTGAQGAATSNLFGGAGSFSINSASTPVKAYMDENGSTNAPVGHRRWILNPSTVTMGMGTTKGFNALNIVGAPTDSSRTSPTMISFPSAGYFPQQLEPNGKWSVSSAQGVDFSGATVSVKDANGTALGVVPLSTAEGYGPNTISFQVQGLAYASGTGEAAYKVTVDNMKKNNLPFSYTYTVRLFDGNVSTSNVAPSDPMPTLPTPVVTVVPAAPTFEATAYTIPSQTGVVYKVNGAVTQAGTYNASTPIAITAEAASGYAVTGETSWSKDFTPVVVEPITVTPIAPTFTATTYTIPYQDGVDYQVNGGSSLQGTYNASAPISITAVALSGYKLSGTTTWSKDFTPVTPTPTPTPTSTPTPTPTPTLTPTPTPTPTPVQVTAVAPTLGATSYTIPSVTGVDYRVNGIVKAAGTYNANTNITITAVAKTGYVLSGTSTWIKDFTPVQVTAVAPTLGVTSYIIPSVTGVNYLVNGSVKAAGTYNASTPITITAVAKTGYVLSGTTTWSKDFTPVQVTAVAPTLGATSYTIPSVTGIDYLVNGVVKAAGTYNANTNITITAVAKTGYVLSGTATWSKDFTPVVAISPIAVKAASLNGGLGTATTAEVYGLKNGGGYQCFQLGCIIWSPATGAHISMGAIRGLWALTGYENGGLGYPTSDETPDGRGGVYQTYERGVIVFSPKIGATISIGAIRGLWLATGGVNGGLGYPTSDEIADGRGGVYQTYEGGAIVYSPTIGPTISIGAIRGLWLATGGVNGGLGYPTSNEIADGRGGVYQTFEHGAIVYSPKIGATISIGAIRGLWLATGGVNGGLGYPTGNETADGRGGVYQTYERGVIVYSPKIGATISIGAIRGLWLATGGVNGGLGYPTSNEIADGRGGVYQTYERGAIVYSPTIGATISWGAIRSMWLSTGGVNGRLGYPTSNEYATSSGNVAQNYQGGIIRWGSRGNSISYK